MLSLLINSYPIVLSRSSSSSSLFSFFNSRFLFTHSVLVLFSLSILSSFSLPILMIVYTCKVENGRREEQGEDVIVEKE
uniref:Uncharacterized protein n=1 Tax=Pristionchus pacificus TaxID=54126 RepID=A0A8R1YQQ7_PRIPA